MLKPVVALLVGLAWTGVASAQTATVIRNEDEPARDYYQQIAYATDCANNNNCTMTFPTIGLNKRTVVTHIACEFSMADTAAVEWAELASVPANIRTPLQVFSYPDIDSYVEYGINTDVYMFFTHLQHPYVDIGWHGSMPANVQCLLTGYTINTAS